MSATSRASALAPFEVRSFRLQWPADLATSWAFEMETLILGWYILVETRSVLLLTLFASLQYTGTLLGPIFGVMGDRIGQRNMLCLMRAAYATLAATLMTLAFTGVLNPVHAFIIAGLTGMIRPSDVGMRATVVSEIMPATQLMAAMGIQRTTQDSARIAGALTGAGLVATLGMGPAYLVVASLYAVSFLLTFYAGSPRVEPLPSAASAEGNLVVVQTSPWRDLKAGLAYVWNTPFLLAIMCLAFLLNATAFPLLNGLLPYVVREVYHADQTVLGYMSAGAATGALLGSIALSRFGGVFPPARMSIAACMLWYAMLLAFSRTNDPSGGFLFFMLAGCAQSLSQVPMAAILLRNSDPRFRGRVMGIRMLAIYGNVPGLLIAGPLIAHFGYATAAMIYCATGITLTLLIVTRWRAHLWRRDAPVNIR